MPASPGARGAPPPALPTRPVGPPPTGARPLDDHESPPKPVGPTPTGARPLDDHESPPDVRVASIATRQHGVVTRAQLFGAGLTHHAVLHRVATGRLIRLSPGVYAVGHLALGWSGRRLAAVLACGPGAALSHADAAVAHSLLRPEPGAIHVTCSRGHPGGPADVITHRGAFAPGDLVRVGPLPLTSPTRTLPDLAAAGAEEHLDRALREAQVRHLVRPQELLTRSARRRGARVLRALLSDEPGLTRSDAERLLLRLLARAGLPAPLTNVRVGWFEVDVLYAAERLVIEVDGFAYHASRMAFESDRERDAELQARGHRVMRVTWRQLVDRPEAVVARVAAALAR